LDFSKHSDQIVIGKFAICDTSIVVM